jgi:hypothetical protein
MIPTDALPTPQERLALYETARKLFLWDGYDEIGIDHFATKSDGLSVAQRNGTLRRNFQGYSDDTADVLLAVGASSIARFPQGYAQNAPATAAHTGAIRKGRFSTSRGHTFTGEDRLRGRMIESLMCDFRIDRVEILDRFSVSDAWLSSLFTTVATQFPDMVVVDAAGMSIPQNARPLTRMIARALDAYDMAKAQHSAAQRSDLDQIPQIAKWPVPWPFSVSRRGSSQSDWYRADRWRRSQKFAGIFGLRIVKQCARLATFDDITRLHHHDLVAHSANNVQIVADKQIGQAVFAL